VHPVKGKTLLHRLNDGVITPESLPKSPLKTQLKSLPKSPPKTATIIAETIDTDNETIDTDTENIIIKSSRKITFEELVEHAENIDVKYLMTGSYDDWIHLVWSLCSDGNEDYKKLYLD
jgi:hypothetical protein